MRRWVGSDPEGKAWNTAFHHNASEIYGASAAGAVTLLISLEQVEVQGCAGRKRDCGAWHLKLKWTEPGTWTCSLSFKYNTSVTPS